MVTFSSSSLRVHIVLYATQSPDWKHTSSVTSWSYSVLARALEIRGATVLVKLPPGFGVSKLTARARDVVVIVMAVVAGVRARQGARA